MLDSTTIGEGALSKFSSKKIGSGSRGKLSSRSSSRGKLSSRSSSTEGSVSVIDWILEIRSLIFLINSSVGFMSSLNDFASVDLTSFRWGLIFTFSNAGLVTILLEFSFGLNLGALTAGGGVVEL